jgi:flavin-dependent dehydrogenase
VFFALRSGELAADAIVSALIEDDVSGERLGEWTTEFFSGTQWIRKLVNAFYTNQFSFGQFLKKYPQHQSNLTDLLIGRIFEGNPGKMFEDMDPAIEQAISGSE